MPTKKKRRLSKKQRGFVKDYTLTENGTQSALKNYDTTDYQTAASIANENLNKPEIIEAISETKRKLFESVPRELPEKVLIEGLEANRVISATITYGDADEKTNDFIEVPDHAVRHKFLDTYVKLTGEYAAEKHVTLNLDVEVSDDIKALAEKLNGV